LVVAKVRERLAASKKAAQKTDTERFYLKKLNERDVKEQYQVTITNKFAGLKKLLEDSGDINRAWDNTRENIKTLAQDSLGYCESKTANRGLIRNVQNRLIEGSRLHYSGCRTQVKQMKITSVM
jgi:triphosphoribosyl-dephospho-CoA synthetase